MELKRRCGRCNKEFEISKKEYKILKKIAKEKRQELVFPKFCLECRRFKREVKQIPFAVQKIVNSLIENKPDKEIEKKLRLIFGLMRKEIRFHLENYGFTKSS